MSRVIVSLASVLLVLTPVGVRPAAAGALADAFGEPVLLGDLVPGPWGSYPFELAPLSGRMLFAASGPDGEVGQVWSTDGTPEGTVRLSPEGTAAYSFSPQVSEDGAVAYFNLSDLEGDTSIWRTDGTPAGTERVLGGVSIDGPGAFGPVDHFYFPGRSGLGVEADVEPWVTDGTPAGTFRLSDTLPGPNVVGVRDFTRFGEAVYFLAGEPGASVAWKTDGTIAGTEVAVAPDGSFRALLGIDVIGSTLYLSGIDGLDRATIWRGDGTTAGTDWVASLGTTDQALTAVYLLADLAGRSSIWAVEHDGSTTILWAIDPDRIGAVSLATVDELERDAEIVGGHAYFLASDFPVGPELFRTDGTREGTGPVADLCPGNCAGALGSLASADGRLLFNGREGDASGFEPYSTDGTSAGTRRLVELCPGPCSGTAFFDRGFDLDGLFVFPASAASGSDRQIWLTDGTPAGTERITSFAEGASSIGFVGARLLVNADDGVHGFEPWALPYFGFGAEPPPPGPWHTGAGLPGFEVKARIRAGGETIGTAVEPACIPETLCLSGALPGRSELFVRVVGPKPNGFLWPTLVKFSTSEIEVWIRQTAPGPSRGEVRYYRLEGARPGFDELPGLFDRDGFLPLS